MEKPKGPDTQDEALLKVKMIRGDILTLQQDVKGLLQYAIDKGGKFSRGVIFKRIHTKEHFFDPNYDYIKTVVVDIAQAPMGPYIRLIVQPLTRKLKVDKRYKPIPINSDLLGPIWKVF